MRIEIDPSARKKNRWYEFAVRFLFGGLITAATGLIAKKFGRRGGGLFLAFPTIFPASATLIEKHEKQNKERAGPRQKSSGRGCRRRRHRKSRDRHLRLAGPAAATQP